MLKHQDAAHTATGSSTGAPSSDYTSQARHGCASKLVCSSSLLCQHLRVSRPAVQQGKAPRPQPGTKRLRANASRAEQCLRSKALILQHGAWACFSDTGKRSQHPPEQVSVYRRDSQAVPKQRWERQQRTEGAVLRRQGKPSRSAH